jgi:hypothetical protein
MRVACDPLGAVAERGPAVARTSHSMIATDFP